MSRPSRPKKSARPHAHGHRTVREFQHGEPEAVEQVRRYVRRILTFRRLGLDRASIPDLEQQVMMQLWRAATRPGFDATAGFWGFVETVTARRCVDALRRDRPTAELPDGLEDAGRSPLDAVLDRERSQLARRVLGQLEAPCRELIELHAVRGLTYRAIAPVLGKSEGALRVQMHRCIESARRLVAESSPRPARIPRSERK